MKITHLFEEQYFLLSNTSVHNDEIFSNDLIRLFMLKKMEFYLGEVLEVSHYLLLPNEFQLLVKTKSRAD
jgi:hypothetical protein